MSACDRPTDDDMNKTDEEAGRVDAGVRIEQPKPFGTGREIAPLVIADIEDRMQKGVETYGERLKAFNGRDALLDAYEESLDQTIYLAQAREERAKLKLWLHIESKKMLKMAEGNHYIIEYEDFEGFVNGLKNMLDGKQP